MDYYDDKILNFIKFVSDENKNIEIPVPTKYVVSTRSAKCIIKSKIDLCNLCFNIAKKIIENIIINNNIDYPIQGIETDNLIIRCDEKYKKIYIKYNGNIIDKDILTNDYYINELLNTNNLYNSCRKKNGRQKSTIENVHFYNSCSLLIKPEIHKKCINIKLFNNGKITLTGSKEEIDGYNAVNILLNELKLIEEGNTLYNIFFDNECDIKDLIIDNYEITMINADFKTNFKLDLKKFLDILKEYENTLFTKFNPERYRGLIIGYYYNNKNTLKDGRCYCKKKCRGKGIGVLEGQCKKITIAVFKSGSIVITGARTIEQTNMSYKFINELIKKYYKDIIKFSILDFLDEEEVKVKEKKI